jgi:hypothetical protein
MCTIVNKCFPIALLLGVIVGDSLSSLFIYQGCTNLTFMIGIHPLVKLLFTHVTRF